MTESKNKDLTHDSVNEKLNNTKNHEPSDQYLTFFMGNEEYGVNILCVQEIRGWEAVTKIPNSPSHVLGFMNLRGNISPIIDLRMCFGVDELVYTDETVVIIVSLDIEGESKSKVIGVVVDAVSDVYNFSKLDIQASPELSKTYQAQYLRGLASTEENMVILLELTGQLIADMDTSNLFVTLE